MNTLEDIFVDPYRKLDLEAALKFLIGDLVIVKPFSDKNDTYKTKRSSSHDNPADSPFTWVGHMTHWTAGSDTNNSCMFDCWNRNLVQFYISNEDQSRPDGKAVLYIMSNGRMGHAGRGNSDLIKLAEAGKHPGWIRHADEGNSFAGYKYFSGVEVEASGGVDRHGKPNGTVWSQAKFDAAFYLAAALCILTGRPPGVHVHHAQWTRRKIDTTLYPDRSTYPWPQAGAKNGWNGTIDYEEVTQQYINKLTGKLQIKDPVKDLDKPSLIKPPVDYIITNFNRTVGLGDDGEDVKEIQTFLRETYNAHINPGPVDGDFGKRTDSAVKRWQEYLGVTQDGLWGNGTRDATAHIRHSNVPTNWNTPIKSGDKGLKVQEIQAYLNFSLDANLIIDGDFGPKTTLQVNKLRRLGRLSQIGVWDFALWDKVARP